MADTQTRQKQQKTGNIPLDTLFNHFYKLNKDQPINSNENDAQSQPQSTNESINKSFTIDEINKHITFLKKNEIPGIDHILNEFIKYFPKFVY